MEKHKYETPELEVVYFDTEDVITTSGGFGEGDFIGTAPGFEWGEWP